MIVYIIKSETKGTYYKGSCADFPARLADHNAGRVKSTKHGKPWVKHYVEVAADKTEALKREKYFKSRSGFRWLKQNGII
jgi:putative endonuclease